MRLLETAASIDMGICPKNRSAEKETEVVGFDQRINGLAIK